MKPAYVSLVCFAVAALTQDSASFRSGPEGFSGSAHFGGANFAVPTVSGAPYSAEEVTESVQTLPDGTRITRTMTPIKIYRDSFGRTRTERPIFRGPVHQRPQVPDAPVIIEITDPVASVRYILDTQRRVAHRQKIRSLTIPAGSPTPPSYAAPTPPPSTDPAAPLRPKFTSERLGTQMVEGVLADGSRQTTTWPAGAQGNDRPYTTTQESWFSSELKIQVLFKNLDPANGEHTRRLANISRVEPDAALFQPPPDYTVVDEQGAFTIRWGSEADKQ